MNFSLNQPQQTRQDLWQELKDLHFVTDFFSWLFALFSRLAEPLMLLCTLYIVAEAGVPGISVPALHSLAIGIMITAPEIILPGSFVVAARAQEHARLLFTVCWIFVALTFLTLISLFVWHFAGTSLAWLMCARCGAAVGYSILMRVMIHGQQVNQSAQQVNQQQQDIEQHFSELAIRFTLQLQEVQTDIVQQVQTLVHSHVTDQVQASQSTMLNQVTEQITTAMQEIKRDMRNVLAEAAVSSSPASSPEPVRQKRTVASRTRKVATSELVSEPLNVRIPRFIQEQVTRGFTPSLREIMNTCHCSRNTAIRYRREHFGDEEE